MFHLEEHHKKSSQDGRNPAKIEDFLRLDYRTGSVINQLTDERVQVIPTLSWRKLRDDWTREFQEKAPFIIEQVGASLGASIAKGIFENIGDPVALGKHIADLSAAAGWGVMAMIGDTRYGTRYTVTVTNCIFCEKEDLADSPQCDFLVGAIKGMADLVYGTPHRVREETCAAMGHALCQLEVEECHDPRICSSCRNLLYCEMADQSTKREPSGDLLKPSEIESRAGLSALTTRSSGP